LKTRDLFTKYSLDENTQTFTGHAIALQFDDSYLDQAARPIVERTKLYAYSVSRYGNSPYIYPVWGLGGLPEGFSRLSAIHGGTYMLNKPIEEILYDTKGMVSGVKSEGKVARCRKLIGDPSYFMGTSKIRLVGQVARCICILSHPVNETNKADSAQIIIPFKSQPPRKTDLYISVVSHIHQVAAQGKYIAVCSCPVETKDPKKELEPAFKLLGKIDQQFFWVSDQYVPNNDPAKDNCFITASYDATTHFEAATQEVLDMYTRLMGKSLDLTIKADPEDLDPANQKDDAPPAEESGPTKSGTTSAMSSTTASTTTSTSTSTSASTATSGQQNQPAPQASPAPPGGPTTTAKRN